MDAILRVSKCYVKNWIPVGSSYIAVGNMESIIKKFGNVYEGYVDGCLYSVIVNEAIAELKVEGWWQPTYYIDGFGFVDFWKCSCMDYRRVQDVIEFVKCNQSELTLEYLFYLLKLTDFYRVWVNEVGGVVICDDGITEKDLLNVKRAYAKAVMYRALGITNALRANLYLLKCNNFHELCLYCGKTIDIKTRCSFGCFAFSDTLCSCMPQLELLLRAMPNRILSEREIMMFKNLVKEVK
jgi:hypothetical protein